MDTTPQYEQKPGRSDKFRADLEQYAHSQGMTVFGVADLCGLDVPHHDSIRRVLSRFPRALSIGVRLPQAVLDDIDDAPTILYAHACR